MITATFVRTTESANANHIKFLKTLRSANLHGTLGIACMALSYTLNRPLDIRHFTSKYVSAVQLCRLALFFMPRYKRVQNFKVIWTPFRRIPTPCRCQRQAATCYAISLSARIHPWNTRLFFYLFLAVPVPHELVRRKHSFALSLFGPDNTFGRSETPGHNDVVPRNQTHNETYPEQFSRAAA